jgi:hypothetical protein
VNACFFPPLNPDFQITVTEFILPSQVTLIGWLGFPVGDSKTKNEITKKKRNIYDTNISHFYQTCTTSNIQGVISPLTSESLKTTIMTLLYYLRGPHPVPYRKTK